MPRPKPPHHWVRQVDKYDRKIAAAKTPTQRAYAMRMRHAAEQNLAASQKGVPDVEPEADGVVELARSEYSEL